MPQTTDTSIKELKTAIDGNTRSIATQSDRIEAIVHGTEANTRAIESIDRRLETLTLTTEANTRGIDGLTKTTEANAKAITDLTKTTEGIDRRLEALTKITEVNTKAITDLTLEVQVGFKGISGQIDTLDAKFEERTKAFGTRLDGKELAQRNIFTGLTVTIVGGVLLTLGRFLFFGISINP